MGHFNQRAFLDKRTGIVLQFTLDEEPDRVDFRRRDRRDLAVEGDDGHDTAAFQNGESVGRVEAGETVAGKERPVDLLLAILPPAPLGNGGQKRLVALLFELLTNRLFVARPRPDGVPRSAGSHVSWMMRCAARRAFSGPGSSTR